MDYFDINWNRVNIKQRFPNSTNPIAKPDKLDEMKDIASKLSLGTRFLRVDLYYINDEVKFSECTFYTDAGYSIFEPESWDEELGKLIELQ